MRNLCLQHVSAEMGHRTVIPNIHIRWEKWLHWKLCILWYLILQLRILYHIIKKAYRIVILSVEGIERGIVNCWMISIVYFLRDIVMYRVSQKSLCTCRRRWVCAERPRVLIRNLQPSSEMDTIQRMRRFSSCVYSFLVVLGSVFLYCFKSCFPGANFTFAMF